MEKFYWCEECNKSFSAKRALQRHLRENKRHRQDRSRSGATDAAIRCRRCSTTFTRAHDYRRHSSEQHGDGKVACPRCQRMIRRDAPHQDEQGNRCCAPVHGDSQARSTSAKEQHQSQTSSNKWILKGKERRPSSHMTTSLQDAGVGNYAIATDAIQCNFCKRPFEIHDNQALREHLDAHLRELLTGRDCSECSVKFVHAEELHEHLHSAKAGTCGFDFLHRMDCNGHHGPVPKLGIYSTALEADRFEFCFHPRQREHAELQVYLNNISALLKPPPSAHTRGVSKQAPLVMNWENPAQQGVDTRWQSRKSRLLDVPMIQGYDQGEVTFSTSSQSLPHPNAMAITSLRREVSTSASSTSQEEDDLVAAMDNLQLRSDSNSVRLNNARKTPQADRIGDGEAKESASDSEANESSSEEDDPTQSTLNETKASAEDEEWSAEQLSRICEMTRRMSLLVWTCDLRRRGYSNDQIYQILHNRGN